MGVFITRKSCGGRLLQYDNGREEYICCDTSIINNHDFCKTCFAETQKLKNENSTFRNSLRETLTEAVEEDIEGIVNSLLETIFNKKEYSFQEVLDDEYLPMDVTISQFSFNVLLDLETKEELINYLKDNKAE